MKYMGSKRAMLRNGLGEVLLREAKAHDRFFDLFTGSGAVAGFVASNVAVPVYARDLQLYGAILAEAVVGRTQAVDVAYLWKLWRSRAIRIVDRELDQAEWLQSAKSARDVMRARRWCADCDLPITRAYGGHYFSPKQSLWIDALRQALPQEATQRTVALAALIDAASECAASPGHTAQPFQPTSTSHEHLIAAWQRDICQKVRSALHRINAVTARVIGAAEVGDAFTAVSEMKQGDLVFIDPPYSALHYSRFYHVLESVAAGEVGEVDGVGRYPSKDRRPRSAYSVKTEAVNAIDSLLAAISERKADVILTFPNHTCSNGLSGDVIRRISGKYFELAEVAVKSRLSTLGGSGTDSIENEIRGARRDTDELIMLMHSPKPHA